MGGKEVEEDENGGQTLRLQGSNLDVACIEPQGCKRSNLEAARGES